MNKTIRKALPLCSLALILFSCENTNFTRNLENIPLPTTGQLRDWEFVTNSLLGIKANDPVNSYPSPNTQDEWTLAYPQKQHLAGRFNRYGTYDEWTFFDVDGYDWNFMIHVSDEFRYLYDPIYESDYSSKWAGCLSPGDTCGDPTNNSPCMWAEIAPDNSIVNGRRWFDITEDNKHCIAGKFIDKQDTLCVYGPFVQDGGWKHDDQPEIHPAQQFWFRNKRVQSGKNKHYLLFFLQDATARFSQWVEPPMYGQYLIAFKVKPERQVELNNFIEPLTMNITMLERLDLITRNHAGYRNDCDNGSKHALMINGQKMVVVNEPENADDEIDLGIQFVGLFKLDDGTVQGYVQISMVIDEPTSTPYGACILGLEIVPAHTTLVNQHSGQ